MGNVLSSPMKLKPGMKVLVYAQPGKFITVDEFLSGLRIGKWIKFEIMVVCSDGWLGLKVIGNERLIAINPRGGQFTVIRSTSRVDNLTPSELRTNERQRKAYRAKKLAATEAKMLRGR